MLLVAREAQSQGIPHRATKFAIQIDQNKYDERNWNELPPTLALANIKTTSLGDDAIAYQSEHSCFSNLYKVIIRIGKYRYTSVEQAYHHIRAVTLKKPLAASRILLASDPYDIMNIGAEFESTKEWMECEDDIMYGCILRKFEQNQDLLKQLLATGNKQLIEATPNTKWGAGATLSSNVLKNRQWRGLNKQGQITMTVRDTIRNLRSQESDNEGEATNVEQDRRREERREEENKGEPASTTEKAQTQQQEGLHPTMREEDGSQTTRRTLPREPDTNNPSLSPLKPNHHIAQRASPNHAHSHSLSSPILSQTLSRAPGDGRRSSLSNPSLSQLMATSTPGIRSDYNTERAIQSPITKIHSNASVRITRAHKDSKLPRHQIRSK